MSDDLNYGFAGDIIEKLIKKYNKSIRHTGSLDLTFSELIYLLAIKSDRMITMSELAQIVDVSMSTATVMVGKLVNYGLVERIRDSGDRRQVYIRMLEKGESVYSSIQKEREKVVEKVMGIFDDNEKKFVFEALIKVYKNLDNI